MMDLGAEHEIDRLIESHKITLKATSDFFFCFGVGVGVMASVVVYLLITF